MRFILVSRGKDFCDVLRWQFRSHPEVEIVCGRFEDLPAFDCVITAGNSFGLMDAGMDLAIVRYFGRHVMEQIQKRILEDYLGEQPVGTCIIVPTGHPSHPFVAHCPTMRVPMNIQGTDHVYLALWAALTAVHRHNRSEPANGEHAKAWTPNAAKINSIACPGLGTGTGGMEAVEASLQLRLAYEHFCRPPAYLNPSVAQDRHEKVYYGGRWGFMHPRASGA
ncbi:MAG TPA: macro domain-containing protein [Candidatus Sulfotelmatobacter sp.]|nr:macro domain-containing protein [Candidatus Sulfotelmatobacter sp.]